MQKYKTKFFFVDGSVFSRRIHSSLYNHITVVMVTVLAPGAVDRGLEPRSCQTKDNKIGMCCFSAKYAHSGERATTGWLGIRIMCQSGATCLSADCSSELAL
jgi:hypothetical protein